MTILVTGGAGYIGSHMVWELVDQNEKVVVLDRLSTGFDWAVPQEVPLYVGDIGDSELVSKIIKDHSVQSIIHFAALSVVPDSLTNPLGYYENNTLKAHKLIQCAIEGGVEQFIFSSTAAVYGEISSDPIDETNVPDPQTPYGASKWMVERILKDACNASEMKYTILRYFNVAGSDIQGRTGQSTPAATHLIKVACETAIGKRNQLSVFGHDYPTPDGTCVRDFIHVNDLVDIHHLALKRLRDEGDSILLNCGYGTGYSVMDVINSVQKLTGETLNYKLVGRRKGDLAAVIANSSLAQKVLSWSSKHADIDTIVGSALKWETRLKQSNYAMTTIPDMAPSEEDIMSAIRHHETVQS